MSRNEPPIKLADLAGWYADVRATLQEKPPMDVAHELPGLVDYVRTEDDDTDRYRISVSFSKNTTCLDYAVERVHSADDGNPYVEAIKTPASGSHRYVQFSTPPDPHFDASAMRARLLAAVEAEYRGLTDTDGPTTGLAHLWEQL